MVGIHKTAAPAHALWVTIYACSCMLCAAIGKCIEEQAKLFEFYEGSPVQVQ
jgi:hypothetical protein